MGLNRPIFFAHVRPQLFGGFVGDVGKQQVAGLDAILDEWEARGGGDLRWLAYMLATAFLETNHTMQPVREAYWLSEAWRKAHLRYYPYYGRGLVQLTWKANYAKADKALGLGGKLAAKLDLALDPKIASDVMFEGMRSGWFTGKKLADYIQGAACDYTGARHIINGTDRAAEVSGYAVTFEAALRAAYAGTVQPAFDVVKITPSKPATEKPKPPPTAAQTGTVGGAGAAAIVAAGAGIGAGHWWLVAAAVLAAAAGTAIFLYVRRRG